MWTKSQGSSWTCFFFCILCVVMCGYVTLYLFLSKLIEIIQLHPFLSHNLPFFFPSFLPAFCLFHHFHFSCNQLRSITEKRTIELGSSSARQTHSVSPFKLVYNSISSLPFLDFRFTSLWDWDASQYFCASSLLSSSVFFGIYPQPLGADSRTEVLTMMEPELRSMIISFLVLTNNYYVLGKYVLKFSHEIWVIIYCDDLESRLECDGNDERHNFRSWNVDT